MSDYPMLISNKLHSFRNFVAQKYILSSKRQIIIRFIIQNTTSNYLLHSVISLIFYDYLCFVYLFLSQE